MKLRDVRPKLSRMFKRCLAMETSRGLEQKAFMENSNFLMVHLRDDLASGDLMHSMRISNVLYNTKSLVPTYLKIIDHILQYYIGRRFLHLLPLS